MPDVTVIGAGPAGSTAAILLARAGWDVTLVEQSRFPRDKVCGECLSALGFDVLNRLELAGPFRERGAVRLDRALIHAADGRSMQAKLPAPMWGLSRAALDALLLDAARTAGAVVRVPFRCESLDPGNATRKPVLRLRDLERNVVEMATPSHVLLADGKAAFADDPPATTGDFGIKTYFADVESPRDAIELFAVRGSYGGLAAVEGERWNAAFSVPARRLKACRGDVESLFAEIVNENVDLARRLARAKRVGRWLAAPLPRFAVRGPWPPRVIPLGNAAAALEPIGGEGIGLALRSAELAAEALTSAAVRGVAYDASSLARDFDSLWRTRRAATRAVARVVSSPRFASAAVRLFGAHRGATRAVMGMLGKA